MTNKTKLGQLIGTPDKDTVPVIYNGRRYQASEEDVRHIQNLVRIRYDGTDYDSDTVTRLVQEDMHIQVFNQENQQMKFQSSGAFDIACGCVFKPGFFDVNALLNIRVTSSERQRIKRLKN